MDNTNIKPLTSILFGPLKFDLLFLERQIETLVLHVADTKKSNLGFTFLKQDGFDHNILDVFDLAKVIYIIICAGLIQG